ncbi:hypothetical protein GOV07_05755 [Candidatus Woesearchaeota archaeon]|nr:hypothetical protein [Candidatus Woesearchaeota archaeon]
MTHEYAPLRTQLIAETKEQIAAAVDTDQFLLQASTSLDQVEKTAHRLIKKTREWYALHNPEHEKAVKDHDSFIAAADLAEKGVMGAELAHDDKEAIEGMIVTCTKLLEEKERLLAYIEEKLTGYAPNLTILAGSRIAAQLLAQAGSLQRLATMPSSTLQLLGAETALFRHLRDRRRHRSPKYGILFNHALIQKLPAGQRGKAARGLADKLSMCAKLDLFKGEKKAAEYKKVLEEKFTTW